MFVALEVHIVAYLYYFHFIDENETWVNKAYQLVGNHNYELFCRPSAWFTKIASHLLTELFKLRILDFSILSSLYPSSPSSSYLSNQFISQSNASPLCSAPWFNVKEVMRNENC